MSKFWGQDNLLTTYFALKSAKMLQISYFWTLLWPFWAEFSKFDGRNICRVNPWIPLVPVLTCNFPSLFGVFHGHLGRPNMVQKLLSGARKRHLRDPIFKNFPSGGQRSAAGPRSAYRRTPLFFFYHVFYAFFSVHFSNYHEYAL